MAPRGERGDGPFAAHDVSFPEILGVDDDPILLVTEPVHLDLDLGKGVIVKVPGPHDLPFRSPTRGALLADDLPGQVRNRQ